MGKMGLPGDSYLLFLSRKFALFAEIIVQIEDTAASGNVADTIGDFIFLGCFINHICQIRISVQRYGIPGSYETFSILNQRSLDFG